MRSLPARILSHRTLNAGTECEPGFVVAIPARDEAERIGECLMALARQQDVNLGGVRIVVMLNNTSDSSAAVVAETAAVTGLCIDLVAVELEPERANAGWARKLAMDHARGLMAADGLLLTTDADTRVDADWLRQNRDEVARGADAVAGYVTADDEELNRIPADILALGADEWELQHLLAEIDARSDPVAHDPWPRHNQNCGASLAIRAGLYDRIGGLPAMPVGEDRAMLDKVRAMDGRVRHSLAVHVVTSARLVGRATGGMADALRTRGTADYLCDDILESAATAFQRAAWRAEARHAFAKGGLAEWCQAHALPPIVLKMVGSASAFGEAWPQIERHHPMLAWHLLRVSQLKAEIVSAREIVANLKAA